MNNYKINDINIIPIKSYINPYINRKFIYKENINKAGIYCWNNLVTGKSYVGSTINLNNRLRGYLSYKYLEKEILRGNSLIIEAILKYDYSNFSLDILEYCDINERIKREQYYIDILNPQYNICKVAGSRLGCKHSELASEILLKYKNPRPNTEALTNLKEAKVDVVSSSITKANQLLITAHIIIIINKKDKSIKKFDSIRKAAKYLDIAHTTLLWYINKNKLFKNNFLIVRFFKWKFS